MTCFRSLAQAFVAQADVRDQSRNTYRQVLGLANDHLGDLSPQDALASLGQLDAAARARGLAPTSRRMLLGLACAVIRSGGVPCTAPRVRDPRESSVRALTRRDAAALEPHLEDAHLVLLHTGLRVNELLALRAADFDQEGGTLRVARSRTHSTKSGRARQVDVPDRVLPVLIRRAARAGGGRMFDCCERALRRELARACKLAQVEAMRLHDLRHTRITQLMLAGAPMLYVSQQAGHATPAYTMRVYGHLAVAPPEERRRWANSA